MTVCVCNPVSMSLGKNLRSYSVRKVFCVNHMSPRQGNHFTNYEKEGFLKRKLREAIHKIRCRKQLYLLLVKAANHSSSQHGVAK